MTLKAKVSSALLFLFLIILLLSGLSAFYLNRLADDSQAILKDNYLSLENVSVMQKALADLTDPDALNIFETSLKKQEANITELSEREATQAVRREFNRLRSGGQTDDLIPQRIQQNLFRIDDLNRQAILRKNETAKQTATDALLWLEIVGTLCMLILLSFIVNFPGYIANPLHELTRGIRQIASRNFEERLHFKSSDEYGELARSFNSMAQKLDEYEHSSLARVLFEKRRIDTLIQIMSEGIIGLDENRRVLFANPVVCRLLGVSESQLAGRYAPDVAASNDLMRTLIQPIMTDAIQPGEDRSLLKIYDEGRESYFNKRIHTVAVTRTGEEQSQLAGYVIVLENITSYKELDLAKTNFIATVSHELKTPLSSIKMSLKLLNDSRVGQLNDEQKQLVGAVRDDADRLLNLTGELLNMAQVESGQIQLNLQPVAPTTIIQYAANALRTQAGQKRLHLNLDIPSNLSAVQADPDKASWVLINFLSNAVRHSPDEGVVDVSARQIDRWVEFRVRDHGAGIKPEHQSRVFDRYFQASVVGTSPGMGQSSGTGLGLAISSEFIQSMNGEIGLDTSVVDGAAFYFRLAVV
jgi:NtrC-family two-component system sensor histidine kinase KinB